MLAANTQKSPYWKVVQEFQLGYAPTTITLYESTRTGMRCVVVDQKGPIVNGYFALATEIHDDSGAPHTLEHLCFMGSKSYPYKGLLDKLATRAHSRLNAWTATDSTVYTLKSAGWDNFAQILPVYLEHLIVPNLTDVACYTEVHHIDGDGKDAGVVYSEMQGVQNTQRELMDLRAKRLMYPEGDGFRYETGGMMEQLRVLTASRIREFHKAMYQSKNMCLVLAGAIDHINLHNVLDGFEETILDEVPKLVDPFTRPWLGSKPTPLLSQTTVEKVNFPDEDESMGEILVGLLGPNRNDRIACTALEVLLSYLCGSTISVMQKTLVEHEQLCSAIDYTIAMRPRAAMWLTLSAIEVEKLETVETRLFELLKHTAANGFDMAYMQDCIVRMRRQTLLKCEDAGDLFPNRIIGDHLFGPRDGNGLKELASIKDIGILQAWTDSQWRDFLSKWLSDAYHVTILGLPSRELSEKITHDEKARVQAQRKRLGEKGLNELEEKLAAAKAENDKLIPDFVHEQFPVPNIDSVHFISTVTARSGAARKMGKLDNAIQRLVDKDDTGSPLFIHFEHIPSDFVRIEVWMCTSSVPVELKCLLTLYMKNFFTSPVCKDGQRMEFDDVVLGLERDTVYYNISSNEENTEMLNISFCTEPSGYRRTIGWIRTLFFDAIHDPLRLRASLAKILADLPNEKRSGENMLMACYIALAYDHSSSGRARSTLAKASYLNRMHKLLEDSPEEVIAKLSSLCAALHRPENFRIKIAANIETLENPVSSWTFFTDSLDATRALEPLDNCCRCLSKVGKNPGSTAVIIPMSAINSSFAMLVSDGPNAYSSTDFPAFFVAQSYMNTVEGPLWAAVRGSGLAYGIHFSHMIATGKIFLRINRSPDAYKAYAAAKEQVEDYSSGKLPLDQGAIQGAVSKIILDVVKEQPTASAAAELSYVNQVMREVEKDFGQNLLKRVQRVTPNQIVKAMRKYMLPVFEPQTATLIVTCAESMGLGVLKNFKEVGFSAKIQTLDQLQD